MSDKISAGFIGLGDIGKPMAKHMVCETINAHVFDIYQPAVDELAAEGAVGCGSLAELAAVCTHIGICVRDDAQVEGLLYGDGGIFANAAAGTLIAVHSTVIQANLLKWAGEAQAKGLRLIDAPMTGGANGAQEGTLCYMVGGTEQDLADVAKVISTSADKIVHAGPLGSGIALKLCNNFIQYAEFVALAEAARLADACGLSLDVVKEVGFANGVVNPQMYSFVSGRNALAPSCTHEQMTEIFGGFGTLARKDLNCALDTAAQQGVTMPTAEFIRDRIESVFLATDESRPPSK
jgi:3-hydroxyisobutyrate dehydrogenase